MKDLKDNQIQAAIFSLIDGSLPEEIDVLHIQKMQNAMPPEVIEEKISLFNSTAKESKPEIKKETESTQSASGDEDLSFLDNLDSTEQSAPPTNDIGDLDFLNDIEDKSEPEIKNDPKSEIENFDFNDDSGGDVLSDTATEESKEPLSSATRDETTPPDPKDAGSLPDFDFSEDISEDIIEKNNSEAEDNSKAEETAEPPLDIPLNESPAEEELQPDIPAENSEDDFVPEEKINAETPPAKKAPAKTIEKKLSKAEEANVRGILGKLHPEEKRSPFDDLLNDIEEIPPPAPSERSDGEVSRKTENTGSGIFENDIGITDTETSAAPSPADAVTDEVPAMDIPEEIELPDVSPEATPADMELPDVSPEATPADMELPDVSPEATPADMELPDASPEATPADMELPEVADTGDMEGLLEETIQNAQNADTLPSLDTPPDQSEESAELQETDGIAESDIPGFSDTQNEQSSDSSIFHEESDAQTGYLDDEEATDAQKETITYLKTFSDLGRAIVVSAVTDGDFTPGETELIYGLLVDLADEDRIVKTIFKILVKKNKAAPDLIPEEPAAPAKPLSVAFKENLLPIIRIIAAGGAILSLIIFSTYQFINLNTAHNYYTEGKLAIQTGEYQRSEDYFLRAEKIIESLFTGSQNTSIKQCNEYAAEYIAQGRFYYAEAKYRRALEKKSNDYVSLLNLARMYTIKEDWHQAEAHLADLISKFPKKNEVREDLAAMYINWGKMIPEVLDKAERMYNLLLIQEPGNSFYTARKMYIEVLRNNYAKALALFKELGAGSGYIEPESHTAFLGMLIDTFENLDSMNSESDETEKIQGRRIFLVSTIKDLSKSIYTKVNKYLPLYVETARWKLLTKKEYEAEQLTDEGITLFRSGEGTGRINPAQLYNLRGRIKLYMEKVIPAIESFEAALKLSPNDPEANFFLGNISLQELNNIPKANEYYNEAKMHWENTTHPHYPALLHGLAYTYYFEGKQLLSETGESRSEAALKIKRSLEYWHELQTIRGGNYLLEYALANAYLQLGLYDLAGAQIQYSMES